MTEFNHDVVTNLLARLRFLLTRTVDFSQNDSATTAAKVRLLTAAAMYFNVLAITEFGGRPGPLRQSGLVEQVVAAAFQSFGGEDPRPDPFDKAAMLLRGIIQGHPFTDGNKRTGFLVATFYLHRMGFVLRPDLSLTEVASFCRQVSAGEIRDVAIMAVTFQAWTGPRREPPRPVPSSP